LAPSDAAVPIPAAQARAIVGPDKP